MQERLDGIIMRWARAKHFRHLRIVLSSWRDVHNIERTGNATTVHVRTINTENSLTQIKTWLFFRCPKRWTGARCEHSTSCKGFCFNGATCAPADDDDGFPACICSDNYNGLRCETKTSFSDASSDSTTNDNSTWILATVIPIIIVLIFLIAIFTGIMTFRIRRRLVATARLQFLECLRYILISFSFPLQ